MKIAELLKGLTNVLVGIAVALLAFRFILRLFGANSNAGFVDWVYGTSGEIMSPFRGVFPTPTFDGFAIDFAALFAILVYGLFGMLVVYIIDILTPKRK